MRDKQTNNTEKTRATAIIFILLCYFGFPIFKEKLK
jgi:hypothetical protein